MSITDEIREYATVSWDPWPAARDVLLRMCDHIDAEHEKAMSRAGQLLDGAEEERDYNYANWQECKQKVLQGNITFGELNAKIEHLMDELSHRIELPKDADDVPWNVGDRDEDGNVVTHLMLTSDGWHASTDGGFSYRPERKRHYHAPTVEDVLREFGKAWVEWEDGSPYDPIAKYAKRLKLAEGEDA